MVQKLRLNIIASVFILIMLVVLIGMVFYYSGQRDKKYNGIFVENGGCLHGCLYSTDEKIRTA
jgi:hypothetical protein